METINELLLEQSEINADIYSIEEYNDYVLDVVTEGLDKLDEMYSKEDIYTSIINDDTCYSVEELVRKDIINDLNVLGSNKDYTDKSLEEVDTDKRGILGTIWQTILKLIKTIISGVRSFFLMILRWFSNGSKVAKKLLAKAEQMKKDNKKIKNKSFICPNKIVYLRTHVIPLNSKQTITVDFDEIDKIENLVDYYKDNLKFRLSSNMSYRNLGIIGIYTVKHYSIANALKVAPKSLNDLRDVFVGVGSLIMDSGFKDIRKLTIVTWDKLSENLSLEDLTKDKLGIVVELTNKSVRTAWISKDPKSSSLRPKFKTDVTTHKLPEIDPDQVLNINTINIKESIMYLEWLVKSFKVVQKHSEEMTIVLDDLTTGMPDIKSFSDMFKEPDVRDLGRLNASLSKLISYFYKGFATTQKTMLTEYLVIMNESLKQYE